MEDQRAFGGDRAGDDEHDRRLLSRVARRERAAFEELYHRHASRVSAYLRGLLDDAGAADEALADVMLAVWRGAAGYAGDARVATWILGIAHHKAIDALRRKRVSFTSLDALAETADTAPGPETAMLHAYDRAAIAAALHALPPDQRAVIALTYALGLSQREIAAILDCPVPTVKTRAFYAKRRLREALAARRLGESIS